jgi:hypothetical protein
MVLLLSKLASRVLQQPQYYLSLPCLSVCSSTMGCTVLSNTKSKNEKLRNSALRIGWCCRPCWKKRSSKTNPSLMVLYEPASCRRQLQTENTKKTCKRGVKKFGLELMVLCYAGLPYDAEEVPARRQHQARGSPHSTPWLLGFRGCV